MSLHPYMGWAGDYPEDGALLVFAHNAREAKPLAYAGINGWTDTEFTEVRVRRIRKHLDYVRTLGDAEKLAEDRAHVIDNPASCKCGIWGLPIDTATDTCERCRAGGDA